MQETWAPGRKGKRRLPGPKKNWVPRPDELGFIPLSAHPWMVHWWLLGRPGRHLRWGKIALIPQLWHLLVGKPVREICTVPSSECFTLGNHPTSSRAAALKPRDFRSENIARNRSKPQTKALVGKFLWV